MSNKLEMTFFGLIHSDLTIKRPLIFQLGVISQTAPIYFWGFVELLQFPLNLKTLLIIITPVRSTILVTRNGWVSAVSSTRTAIFTVPVKVQDWIIATLYLRSSASRMLVTSISPETGSVTRFRDHSAVRDLVTRDKWWKLLKYPRIGFKRTLQNFPQISTTN